MSTFRVLMTDTIFPDTTIEQEELRRIDAEFVLAPTTDPDTLKREGARLRRGDQRLRPARRKEILDAWRALQVDRPDGHRVQHDRSGGGERQANHGGQRP